MVDKIIIYINMSFMKTSTLLALFTTLAAGSSCALKGEELKVKEVMQ